MTLSQSLTRHDAAVSEYLEALKELHTRVTPLEILVLAETRQRDPSLALRIAEQSARQATGDTK